MACQRMAYPKSFPVISTKLTSISRVSPPKLDPKLSFSAKLRRVLCLALLFFVAICFMSFGFRVSRRFTTHKEVLGSGALKNRYLYWGPQIDCPGKHCLRCAGLGHQESSLRCALEEAMVLNRTFVLPSTMCIAADHSNINLPMRRKELEGKLQYGMDKMYDLALMSHRVHVISSDSKEWQDTLLKKDASFLKVDGIKRDEVQRSLMFQQAYVINRSASRFMECKNRHNQSSILLPYLFLPTMVAYQLRAVADLIKKNLKDYDALHVRRGDKVEVWKDKSGANHSMYASLDNDTQSASIMERIKLWIPIGRTLYIATNEKQVHYFDQLSTKYNVVKAADFSAILNPVVHNNYQLFMVERLVILGAKTLVKTWKEAPGDLSLSDEAKKKPRRRKHAVNLL